MKLLLRSEKDAQWMADILRQNDYHVWVASEHPFYAVCWEAKDK